MISAVEIYELVEQRRKELGMSQAQLGELAFGQPNSGAIQNLKRGSIPSAERLSALADALNLEFHFGRQRAPAQAQTTTIGAEQFETVARYDAAGSAGDGALNFDGPPIDHLAFSRCWLAQQGIDAASCVLINVTGDSMEPAIYHGDLVMIDQRKTHIRSGKIYAFRDGETLRIKRIEVIPDTALILRSDNPKHPPDHRIGEAMNHVSQNILGQAVWSGHNWG